MSAQGDHYYYERHGKGLPLKITLLHELFGAVRTLVTGTDVYQEMFVEGVSPAELLAAVLALVDLVILVAHPVVVQTVLGHEPEAADTAEVGIALRVIDFVVKTPLSGAVEHFVADFAEEALLTLLAVRGGEVSLHCLPRVELSLTHLTLELDVLCWRILLLVRYDVLVERFLNKRS